VQGSRRRIGVAGPCRGARWPERDGNHPAA